MFKQVCHVDSNFLEWAIINDFIFIRNKDELRQLAGKVILTTKPTDYLLQQAYKENCLLSNVGMQLSF